MRSKIQLPSISRRPALILALLFTWLLPAAVQAVGEPAPSISLAWNANPELNIAGYKLYFGTQSGVYTDVTDVGAVTTALLPQMTMGSTYYMAVSAYNGAGVEGPRSPEFVVTAAVPVSAEETVLAMSGNGQGALKWKYPKSASATADRFQVLSSEDLVNWEPAGVVLPAGSASSDQNWIHYSFPFEATKPRMFFRVGASNAFGISE